MTITGAAAALRARKVSSVELTTQCLRAIADRNAQLNAFMTVQEDVALAEAKRADEELAKGVDRGPLHGIPIAHKDLIDTRGLKTTSGSPIYKDRVPAEDATIARKLREGGTVLLGKTGLHELAYGITSTNPHFGAVRNPHDPERIPGGSSGGSGVAIATGMAMMATGTDTGGSIRIPSSFCGVVGLKPTFGRVSKQGVQPLGYSLDHIGPMVRTVRDAALCFEAMIGEDPLDDTTQGRSGGHPHWNWRETNPSISKLRIGLPSLFDPKTIDLEVHASVRKAFQSAAALGAEVVEFDLPDMETLSSCSLRTLLPEAAHVHRAYKGKPELFGKDVYALLERGWAVPAYEDVETRFERARLRKQWSKIWEKIDVLFLPGTPTPAPQIGETDIQLNGRQENVRILTTFWVRGFNLLGWPVLTIPCGRTKTGLPLGLQIIGPEFEEERILRAGAALEAAIGYK
jgi:aspartyl-tRNA(Asn)/glutamyl-tRNA(Gln) amidotransferase subunit A